MKRTLEQNKRLHTLLTSTGLSDDKRDLVSAYSTGRTTSSAELTEDECRQLILHLEAIEKEQLKFRQPVAPVVDEADKMRKKIIAKAHEMRWEVAGGKADMARINNWCRTKGYGLKPLNAYTLAELPRLVSQFDIVYQKFLADMATGK